MKRSIAIGILGLLLLAAVAIAKPNGNDCTTIQSGDLESSTGDALSTGYDQWGYNYQAHMFNSNYCNYRRGLPVPECPGPWDNVDLIMQWNDAWLSNKDCDGDDLLDRHYETPIYTGSGAWLTNHMRGEYEDNGDTCRWEYFVKIVAAPADANNVGGYWKTADGTEIGQVIWGSFAIIQSIYMDQCSGVNGIGYLPPSPTGFGYYM